MSADGHSRPFPDETMRAKHVLDQSRWWEKASCAGAPFALFDAPVSNGRPSIAERRRYEQAAAICAGCPVITECRADADLLKDPSFRAGYPAHVRIKQNRAKRAAS